MTAAASDAAVLAALCTLTDRQLQRVLSRMERRYGDEFVERWRMWAHGGQVEPPGAWRVWLIKAGRGFGKTRAGAEWVSEQARAHPGARIALVGATALDGLRVMIEGPSGLKAVARLGEKLDWRAGASELHFGNGCIATLYSAETPDILRGPQHHFAWCDELAKWRRGDAAWDNLMMTMREGERPRVLVTTTPKAGALLSRLLALDDVEVTEGRTLDNPHLPGNFLAAMVATYDGTRLGRQELDGELLEDAEGALWTRALVEACRVAADSVGVPRRVVIGVDPPAGGGAIGSGGGDACGIVVCGALRDGRLAVLEDASVVGLRPRGWAQAVSAAAARWGADRVVAERNQGGAMVAEVLLQADPALPVQLVWAAHGKGARAEPVALRYERGEVVHAGVFAALEDELCGLVMGGGYAGPGRSPDRADACVWALTVLGEGVRAGDGVRVRVV